VILFREESFFLDNEAGRGPPKEADYRIRDNDNDDDEESSAAESRGASISFDEELASDITFSLAESSHQTNKESTATSESTTIRVREIRARLLYTGPVGCPASESDLASEPEAPQKAKAGPHDNIHLVQRITENTGRSFVAGVQALAPTICGRHTTRKCLGSGLRSGRDGRTNVL
jgi:hypothetical protein